MLERSDLAQTLLLSMAAVENQPAIKLQLLQTLQILSSSSGQSLFLFWMPNMEQKGGGDQSDMSIQQMTSFIR